MGGVRVDGVHNWIKYNLCPSFIPPRYQTGRKTTSRRGMAIGSKTDAAVARAVKAVKRGKCYVGLVYLCNPKRMRGN